MLIAGVNADLESEKELYKAEKELYKANQSLTNILIVERISQAVNKAFNNQHLASIL
jgi:hypothetical protein